MKHRTRFSVWLALALACFALAGWSVVAAQRGPHHVWGAYDPDAETTVTGEVTEVKKMEMEGCPGSGTHLMLESGEKTWEVLLGPTAYLEKRKFAFQEGDEIEVTGAPAGGNQLIARQVKMENRTLTLRGKDGRPRWAGPKGDRGPRGGAARGRGRGPGRGPCWWAQEE